EDRVAAAGEADEERSGNPHRRAGDPGDRGQREQLPLREREAEIQHLHGDDSPHSPYREAAEERGHRDREVAVRDALAGLLPERRVLGAPVGDVGAAAGSLGNEGRRVGRQVHDGSGRGTSVNSLLAANALARGPITSAVRTSVKYIQIRDTQTTP